MAALIDDIWSSFRRLPGWVQVWVGLILVPVNLTSLVFVFQPLGPWVAFLAVGGMAPNLVIMAVERGLSKLMSLPHLLLWPPLLVLTLALMADPALISEAFWWFLAMLFVVDAVSLAFDGVDFSKWLRGDRAIT